MKNKLSSGRRLHARLGGGAGILQNVANQILELLWVYIQVGYLRPELQGCSRLVSQQLIVTTWKFFPYWKLASCQSCKFCSVFMLHPPHVHMPSSTPSSSQIQALHHHSHHGGPACQVDTPIQIPDPQGTLKFLLAPGMFLCCFFFPSQFFLSEVFRGFFFCGYVGHIS